MFRPTSLAHEETATPLIVAPDIHGVFNHMVEKPKTKEIEPGIRVVPAQGHTPGHITVWLSPSQHEQLVVVSDLVLHPIHVEEPGWVVGSDMWPDRVAAERRALFAEASVEGCRMMAFHLPFPGLGRIVAKGRGWRWETAI